MKNFMVAVNKVANSKAFIGTSIFVAWGVTPVVVSMLVNERKKNKACMEAMTDLQTRVLELENAR